jgi:hypothetical protein
LEGCDEGEAEGNGAAGEAEADGATTGEAEGELPPPEQDQPERPKGAGWADRMV